MPIQPLQLDDRDFEQLFQEARARIPVHTPLWTNFNESDPGITLVRLFAFMTENLLYRSNRIPEANRRKFLTLLGIGLQPASAGQGLVSFSNDRGPLLAFPLDKGQEIRAGKVPFRTRTGLCILPVTAAVFYKQPRNDLDEATKQQYQDLFMSFLETPLDQLTYYQAKQLDAPEIGKPLPVVDLADSVNGTMDRSLWVALLGPQNAPVDAVRAAIAEQTLTLGIYPALQSNGTVLTPATSEDNRPVPDPGLVFEIAAPDPDPQDPSVGTGPASYERLTLDYAENVLQRPGIVQFRLPKYNKLLLWDFDPEEEGTDDFPPLVEDKALAARIVTWIRIRLPRPDDKTNGNAPAQQQAQLTWIGTNAARVIQSLPVKNELLGTGTGAPGQAYKVANTPVIVDPSAPDEASGAFVLEVQDANNAWQSWQLIDDLYAAQPADKVYTLDPESGNVTFGSGLTGLRPPLGKNIRVSYEYGGGSEGAVAIGAINKSAALPGGFKVVNPLPTWGAQDGESVADGELRIASYLRHRDTLVTADDFRAITRSTPGVNVGRVEVLPLFNPERFDVNNPAQKWAGTITVLVIPTSDPVQPDAPEPDRLFLDAVANWLDPRRLITTEVYVRGPIYKPLWVSVGIVTMAGQVREIVQRNVQAALRNYLSPLVGGPPVALEGQPQGIVPTMDATTNGLYSTGWPLSTDVRRQDLEAVATRVPGVRYVDSIKLGAGITGPTMQTDVERVPLAGLQLPWLVGISVREGAAEDLAALLNLNPKPAPTRVVAVPVLPKTC